MRRLTQSFVTNHIESSSHNESDNNNNIEKNDGVENIAKKPNILNEKEVREELKEVPIFKSDLRAMKNMKGLMSFSI